MTGKRKSFKVTLTMPDGVSVSDLKRYIKESIETWKKAGDPDDDFFWHELRVKVETLKELTTS